MKNDQKLMRTLAKKLRSLVTSPSVATTSLLVFAVGYFSAYEYRKDQVNLDQRVETQADRVKQEIAETLKQTSSALERYARRVEYLGAKDQNFLELDSRSYLHQLPILKRIGITDANNKVIWSYPTDLSFQVQGFSQLEDPLRAEALADARKKQSPSMSHLVELRSGGKGFIIPIPLFPSGKFAGYVYATVEADRLFNSYVESKDFQIEIRDGDQTAFRSQGAGQNFHHLAHVEELAWGIARLQIEVAPTQAFLNANRSSSSLMILLLGFPLSLIVGLFLASISNSRRDLAQKSGRIDKLNAQISEALELRKAMLNATGYSIISTDANGIIQTFNDASTKMFGYSVDEVVGKLTPAVFHLAHEVIDRTRMLSLEIGQTVQPGMATFTTKARLSGRPEESEWTFVRKDGTQFPANLSLSVLRNDKGEITGYLGVSADLTDRKRAERELNTTSDRLTRLIEATEQGLWERDYGGSNEITFIDAQAKRIFGFDPQAPLSYEQVIARVDERDRPGLAEAIRMHATESTPSFEIEFRLHVPNEGARWIHARGRVVREPGKARLISTVRDATEEVTRREQLREALEAAQAGSRAKADFLANMSHEIRTPLNGIIGMTDLLLETPLDSVQNGYAHIVQQSGASLLMLINDILDFSKIEAGRMDLEKVKFSLGQLVESQAEVLMAKAREKDLTLMTYIDPQVPQDVHGDPGRIGQILLNLMGNAIKFSSRGGVTVSVTRVAERIRFDVQDTGIGISRDAQMRLFKPFTQADRSTSRKYGGTGLGLSISKRLVELMEGDIGVNSMIGAGSVFWFELPFVGLEAPKLVHLKGRALLIEGDPVASPILNRYLRAWGLDCQPLKTTNVTAESLSTYDVVVIGNGRNVGASHLEQLAQLKDISPPIILLNEMGQSIDSQLSEALEITTLVSNPLKGLALYEALVQALGVKVESVKDFDIPQIAPPVLEIKKSTARILVAEDVKVNQLLVLKQLEHLGYTAHVVANGNEVIEALGRVEYDLVLMDCQMPELDGFEATKLIRKSHDEYMRTIPIIALTANAMSGDDKICLAAGMNDYLSKPFKRETLQAKLEYWLAQKAPPRQAA